NIFYDKYKNANEIIKALKLIDIDDNDFKKSFSIYSKKATSGNDEKVHKLGNYILLEAKYNQQLKNKNFKEKIDIYSKSNFKLAQYVAENFKTWDTKSIDQYQNFLAKQALALWKF
ncbi:HNH endonuclease, partial [Campylobacter jejuni]|nr:HNH endonuclease [Campylobacter jejuni]